MEDIVGPQTNEVPLCIGKAHVEVIYLGGDRGPWYVDNTPPLFIVDLPQTVAEDLEGNKVGLWREAIFDSINNWYPD